MRIALDATYTVGHNLTGIGVYSNRLMTGLSLAHPDDRFLFCYRPKQFLKSKKPVQRNAGRRILQPPLPVFDANLFHALNQRVDRRPTRRVVSTFHDLFVMTAEYSSKEFRARFTEQARRAVANSDLIIAVSSFTAGQVSSLLNVDRSLIRVVPHGVELPGTLTPWNERENMILLVGALQTRKNVVRHIEAFEELPSSWRLVLAGAADGYGAPAILHRIAQSPARQRVELTGHVPHRELRKLYQRARIFAFATLDEGFGIPVLEAMAHGIPVVTSDRSALPEIAANAAILVDPYKSEQIEAALRSLIESPSLCADMAVRGRARAELYPWSRTVDETYAVYRELIG